MPDSNLVSEMLPDSSRLRADLAVDFLSQKPEYLEEFIVACESGTGKLPLRASRVVHLFGKENKKTIAAYHDRLLLLLDRTSNESVTRNLFSLFESILETFTEKRREDLLRIVFEKIQIRNAPIAVRVMSLRVLDKLTVFYPDIKTELYSIAQQMREEPHPATMITAGRILKKLSREIF